MNKRISPVHRKILNDQAEEAYRALALAFVRKNYLTAYFAKNLYLAFEQSLNAELNTVCIDIEDRRTVKDSIDTLIAQCAAGIGASTTLAEITSQERIRGRKLKPGEIAEIEKKYRGADKKLEQFFSGGYLFKRDIPYKTIEEIASLLTAKGEYKFVLKYIKNLGRG